MKKHSISVTKQCAFKHPKTKQRCNVQTTVTHPYCWRHTREVLGVSVKKSLIPKAGMGLFAEKDFSIGDDIVQYKGAKMTLAEYDAKYSGDSMGSYGMMLDDNTVLDAAKTSWGVARYACDYHGSRKKNNAEFVHHNNQIWIIAIWPIKKGEEILVDYGEEMHVAMKVK